MASDRNEAVTIGARIRDRRQEKGLSLQELADRTELTPSFLSQVERDLAEPSITSLRKIADALGVPMFYFLFENHRHNPVVRRSERRVLNFPRSQTRLELMSPGDLDRKMELVMTRLAPGAQGAEHGITHPGEECMIVISGRMEIEVGDQRYLLDEGDSIYFYSSIPHRISNAGDTELVVIAAITPPLF